ncbi:MAG: 2-isopropylmalate synthase [Rhodothermales bacterium]
MPNPNHITIFDTTLRDGEQAPGAAMTMRQKVRIAHQLEKLGVDVIEAGFPVSSPQQFDAVRQIAAELSSSTICALARAIDGDIRAAGDALLGGSNTRIHTFIATSDIHIDAKFSSERFGATLDEKRQSVIRMAVEAVQQARVYTDNVEFSAEDAGRTDIGYLCEIVSAVIEAGATTINIPDTTGYCIPDEYRAMFANLIERCQPSDDIIFSTHCHDDLGLAVANSIAGVQGGARQVECTINGIGERAGNASLEEVVMALHVRGNHYGYQLGIQTRELMNTSRMVSLACGFPVPPNKAIVGTNAFSHEAGIHQHGVLKRRDTYEIMRAEDVGQQAEQIRLGRHSGRHGFFSRLINLGVEIAEEQKEDLYQRFVELADRKKEIYDEDLLTLVNNAERVPSMYFELVDMAVAVQSSEKPRAEVALVNVKTGEQLQHRATGDGPIDALYRAIDEAVGCTYELEAYTIQSISEGADAFGEVSVVLSSGGENFHGTARNTDVIAASAEAYMVALNHVEAHRHDEENAQFIGEGIMQSFQGGIA